MKYFGVLLVLAFVQLFTVGCTSWFADDDNMNLDEDVITEIDPTNENTIQTCTDFKDNDGDGDTDCVDSECANLFPGICLENTEEACQDGIDNDNDLDTLFIINASDTVSIKALSFLTFAQFYKKDTTMKSLTEISVVMPDGETYDAFKVDMRPFIWDLFNKQSKKMFDEESKVMDTIHTGIDCSDPDCKFNFAFCGEFKKAFCLDGIDNDTDGVAEIQVGPTTITLDEAKDMNIDIDDHDIIYNGTDCLDEDCYTTYPDMCGEGQFVLCKDEIDNDGDGYTDCEDEECYGYPTLCGEKSNDLCGDHIDNDGNGYVDCEDPNCIDTKPCLYGFEDSFKKCTDKLDNDYDGMVDCDDDDCVSEFYCKQFEDNIVNCTDSLDNDDDGKIDCNDDDCKILNLAACDSAEITYELCTDGVDNDGDDEIDCLDFQCFDAISEKGEYACEKENSPGTCTDKLDNDLDGLYDCDDDECFAFKVCKEDLFENSVSRCTDGADNDADGVSDCKDSDCFDYPACNPKEDNLRLCSNELDDDADGNVDCEDEECKELAYCVKVENSDFFCSDKTDNDLDELIDCKDPDCAGTVPCTFPENTQAYCSDNIDNDVDGLTDCEDEECLDFDICEGLETSLTRCKDEKDNDGDGQVDCDDTDCLTFLHCQEEENTSFYCTDNEDNDGDGAVDCDDTDCLIAGVEECIDDESSANIKTMYGCFDTKDNDGDGVFDCLDPECEGVVYPEDPNISCPELITLSSDSIMAISKDDVPESTFWFITSNPELKVQYIQQGVIGALERVKQMGVISKHSGVTIEHDGNGAVSPLDGPGATKVDITLLRFDSIMKEVTHCEPDDWHVVAGDSLCGPNNNLIQILDTTYQVKLEETGAAYHYLADVGMFDPFDISYWADGYIRFDIKTDFDMVLTLNSNDGGMSTWLSEMDRATVKYPEGDTVKFGWYPPGDDRRSPDGWSYMRFRLQDLGAAALSQMRTVFSIGIPAVHQYLDDDKVYPPCFSAKEEFDYKEWDKVEDYKKTKAHETDSIRAYSYWVLKNNSNRDQTEINTVERSFSFTVDNIYYGDKMTSTCLDIDGKYFCDK